MIKLKENPDKAINLLAKIYKLAYDYKYKIWLPDNNRLIITSSCNVKLASDVFLYKLPSKIEELRKKFSEVDTYLKTLDFVHEKLNEILGDEILKYFGVKEVSFENTCRNVLLPKIYVDAPKLEPENLLIITAIIKESNAFPDKPIWILATDNTIRRSDEVYYPLQHFKDYITAFKLLNIEFLDIDRYLKYGDEEGWQRFFSRASVRGLSYDYYNDYMVLVSRIRELLEHASRDTNIQYLRILKHLYENVLRYYWKHTTPMKIITDQGLVADSEQCLLHDRYDPEEKWIRWKNEGFSIGPFITSDYIENATPENISIWREFLTKVLGVKDKVSDKDIERFGEWFAQRKLENKRCKIEGRCGEGCDLIIKCDDETIYVEVKGRRKLEWDIELSEKESQMAYKYRDKYWLIVVTDMPNDPKAYLVKNPSSLQARISIPVRLIKEKGELM